MATDKKNRYMATGDVDGVIKVWDITEYCVTAGDDVINTSPRKSQAVVQTSLDVHCVLSPMKKLLIEDYQCHHHLPPLLKPLTNKLGPANTI